MFRLWAARSWTQPYYQSIPFRNGELIYSCDRERIITIQPIKNLLQRSENRHVAIFEVLFGRFDDLLVAAEPLVSWEQFVATGL